MMKRLLLLLPVALLSCAIQAQSVRETVLLDKGWKNN